MRLRTILFAVVVLLLFTPATPVLTIGYAESGSMEPAIPTDSLYIVSTTDSNPEVGDVVMYTSDNGERVTHRVVDRTETGGYITQGDANDATDQVGSQPPLSESDIIGTVPTIFGSEAVIPGSSIVAGFAVDYPLASALSMWLVFSAVFFITSSTPKISRNRDVVMPVLAVAFIACVVLLSVGPAYQLGLIGTNGPHEGNPNLIPSDERTVQTIQLDTSPPPISRQRIVTASGEFRITDVEDTENGTLVSVSIPPTADGEVRRGQIRVNYYPPVLPTSVMMWLHGIHPIAAALAATTVCFLPVYGLYLLLTDPYKRLRPYVGWRRDTHD